MKIGIVGSSKAKINEQNIRFVEDIMDKYPPDTTFVSGGAKGVDELVMMVARVTDRPLIEHKPKTKNWEGYKERNLLIAKECDKVICVALKSNDKDTYCYHCGSEDHERTGGCWTARRCEEYEVVILGEDEGDKLYEEMTEKGNEV